MVLPLILSWMLAHAHAETLTNSEFMFQCDKPESVWGLKALYACQSDPKFGACGSLAGYLSNRPITTQAKAEALKLIEKAKGEKLAMPPAPVISSLRAMEKGAFALDAEDLLFMAVPGVGIGGIAAKSIAKGLQSVGFKMISNAACAELAHVYMNSNPAKKCKAEPTEISPATFDYLNSDEKHVRDGLKFPKVCEHYKHRFEAQIRRNMYSGLDCGTNKLASYVGQGESRIERILEFDSQGVLTKVDILLTKDADTSSSVTFKNGVPDRLTSQMGDRESGERTLAAPVSRVSAKDPIFSELSRLKTESAEMIACCRLTDASAKARCSQAFDGRGSSSTTRPEPVTGTTR